MGHEAWPEHGSLFDPMLENIDDFPKRVANAPDWLRAELEPSSLAQKHAACQTAIATVAKELQAARPDVLVVVGDDQKEMFAPQELPALAIFAGNGLLDLPSDVDRLPPTLRAAEWALHGNTRTEWLGSTDLGTHLSHSLIEDDFDVFHFVEQAVGRTIGHAFTFVCRRLYQSENVPPLVPIFLNTYYPPTQMRLRRCWALGRAIRRAIDAWESDARVAIIGSGGLSHFILDPALDQQVLGALGSYDEAAIGAIPESMMRSGTSEIKNWVVAGAALEGFEMRVVDYVPAYRTGAATGIGLAFALWRPE